MELGKNILNSLLLVLVGITLGGMMVYGYYSFNSSTKTPGEVSSEISQTACQTTPSQGLSLKDSDIADGATAYLRFKEIKDSVLVSGVPEYSSRLNVSYDQAAIAVDILAKLEDDIGLQNLTESEKARYIKIGTTQGTACEFCCGLKTSFAQEDGQRACGCGHNIAFSGLTMWMIQNDYSDEQILEEIAKWKGLFFPKQTLTQKLDEMEKVGEPGIKEILEEFPDFLPQMVGGC